MASIESTLGSRIRAAREEKKLSQRKLAELCGVNSASIISNWETNTNKPDLDKFVLLCRALEVSSSYLLDYRTPAEEPLNREESSLLEKFRQIDERGIDEVMRLLDNQIQWIANYEDDETRQQNDTSEGILMPIFLSPTDPSYSEIAKKRKDLKLLKRTSKKSYMDITRHLWKKGYGDAMCLAYVISIFGGGRVPSSQLYQHIEEYLRS